MGKGVVTDIDDLSEIERDEEESKGNSQKIKEKKLKEEKEIEDNIQTEMTVFDYDGNQQKRILGDVYMIRGQGGAYMYLLFILYLRKLSYMS